MKTFLKRFGYFVVIVAICGFGYSQYSGWVNKNNLAEQKISPQGQLPQHLTPTHYQLSLRIDPDKGVFSGNVNIAVDLTKSVNELWLHGKDFDVSEAKFIKSDKQSIALTYKEMGGSGVVRLSTNEAIQPQSGHIDISFKAKLADDLAGLYKVEDGGLAYAFTQFQAIDARRAFPGFDEPRFKTPYDIVLEVKEHHHGLANTQQIKEEKLNDGFKRLTFSTTKPLPTYLLAFVVGEVDIVEYADIPATSIRKNPIPLRGIATKGKGKDFEYALANTADILAAQENYFGMPYPYDKLDIVAVPDFRAGAMENAGLITYREQLLLLGDNPSLQQIRSYASVHAHELAHQWFGNLVTMRWWDDIWLNESFATWMADATMHKWDPALGFDRQMVRSGHRVMNRDVFADTRQIREPINHNADIEDAFDGITYTKGGAMLQMFEAYVGEENFRKGVQHHMKTYAFGNADATEFLASISKFAPNKQVDSAFDSFLNQNGVPLVKVDYQCTSEGLELNLSQERYLPTGARSSVDRNWQLPVCVNLMFSEHNSQECTLLNEQQATVTLAHQTCPVAVMPNANGKGYFRWSMEKSKLDALLANQSRLNAGEQYSLASTLSAEFDANRITASDYVNSIGEFTKTNDWNLITQPINTIDFISTHVADEQQKQQLQQRLSELYNPVLKRVGLAANTEFDKTNPNDAKMLRKNVVEFMALDLQQPELLNQLAAMASEYIGFNGDKKLKPEAIDPNTVSVALSAGVIVHKLPFVEALLEHLENSEDGTLRQRMLGAIAISEDPQVTEKVLDLVTSFSLRVNERIGLLVQHMQQPNNMKPVYEWIKGNFGILETIIPSQYMQMTPRIATGFCSDEMYADAKAFFEPKLSETPGMDKHLSKTLEGIEICKQTAKKHQAQPLAL